MSWVIYTRSEQCMYSKLCTSLLRKKGLEFEEKADLAPELLRQELAARGCCDTRLPQAFMCTRHVGGWAKLRDAVDEPLLQANPLRYTPYPIQHDDLWRLYKQAVASFWTVEEIDFSRDRQDWAALTDGERHFISHVLAFFASSDGIVQENLMQNFCNEVQVPEARQFYACQVFIESVHSDAYGLLLDTYIEDPHEKLRLFQAIRTIPCVQKKADWALKWLDASRPFAQRLLAFICVEGILFSGSFCAIYWLKKRGLMPGLTFSNELIARDEGLHQQFGERLYVAHLNNRMDPDTAAAIVREAVEHELEFVTEALPVSLIGMNAELMADYVRYVADRIMLTLGYPALYNVKECVFGFMESISLQSKASFFESRVSSYQKAHVAQSEEDKKFAVDEDF